ncbi:unnamed protein product [Linum tenue]|uniref:Uncharacterized protein n=1 Tax=Linum tenue TaxID=586396 RepID=A0AAV0MVC1_9ROSI|nr:unnamed protein product [Linum tenue]
MFEQRKAKIGDGDSAYRKYRGQPGIRVSNVECGVVYCFLRLSSCNAMIAKFTGYGSFHCEQSVSGIALSLLLCAMIAKSQEL